MNWFSNFIINLILVFQLCFLAIFSPFFLVFSKKSILNTLTNINIYDQTINLGQKKLERDYNLTQSFYLKIMSQNLTQVITKSYFEITIANIINIFYNNLAQNKPLIIVIDIKPVKQNLLKIISTTDLSNNLDMINKAIPDQVSLSQLLNLSPNGFQNLYKSAIKIIKTYHWSLIVAVFLWLSCLIASFFISINKQFISLIIRMFFLSGLIIIFLSLATHYYLKNPIYINSLFLRALNTTQSLGLTIALVFVNKLLIFWFNTGVAFCLLALLIFLFTLIKHNKSI